MFEASTSEEIESAGADRPPNLPSTPSLRFDLSDSSGSQFHEEVLARWLRGVPRNGIYSIAEGSIHQNATPWGNSPGVRRESLNPEMVNPGAVAACFIGPRRP